MNSIRRAPLFLLVLTGCLAPVGQLGGSDAGSSSDASADAGTADAGACKGCLPQCLPSCEGGDAGCAWTRLTEVKPAGCEATGVSLASSGTTVRVAYCSCGKARLAEGQGTQWTDDLVQDGCVRTALRTDPVTGEPRLLVELPGGGLRLLERTGSTWKLEIPPQIGAPADLVVDSDGFPHLVGVGQGALLHVLRTKAWHVETAAPAPSLTPGARVHLALGKEDRLAVAYSAGELRVALSTDTGWESSTVASSGLPVGLVLDAGSRPHVLYLQQGLRYAVRTGSAWTFEPVEPRATGGAFVLAGGGCPRVALVTDLGLSFAERTAGGWTGGLVQGAGFTGLDEPLLEHEGALLLATGSPVQVLQR